MPVITSLYCPHSPTLKVPLVFDLPQVLKNGQTMGRGVILLTNWGAVANTDTTLTHGLGRIPIGYIPLRTRLGGVVHDGANHGTDWTTQVIVLQNTVASDVTAVWIL